MTLEEAKEIKKSLIGFDPEDGKECLEIAKWNGWCLAYVKEQTPEICLEVVKQNGYVL